MFVIDYMRRDTSELGVAELLRDDIYNCSSMGASHAARPAWNQTQKLHGEERHFQIHFE